VGWIRVYRVDDLLPFSAQDLHAAGAQVAAWQTQQGLFDDLPSNIMDITIDHRGTGQALVYVGTRRVGIDVLEFDAVDPQAVSLIWSKRIQTGEFVSGTTLQELPGGPTRLVISDYGGGVRVYEQ
jgi:hypothetical protein